ncbi:MAG: transporter substrate-binding domain-containing protein [Pseudomonadota bacterium]
MTRLIIALFLVLLCGKVAAEQELTLIANTSPPYADNQLPDQGLAMELVKHVFSRTDYTPEITIESWSRAVEGARLGVYQALASVWYSPDRDKDLLFSQPYLRSELIILKRRTDTTHYRELADLAGKRLGVRTDYAYGVDFRSVPGLQLVEENHLVQLLLRLLNGSVDAVIGDRRTVTMQLNEFLQDRLNEFAVTPIQLPDVERHVAASRSWEGHEAMIGAFNKALIEVEKDGSHAAIIKQWDERYGEIQ